MILILVGTQGGNSMEIAKIAQRVLKNGYDEECIYIRGDVIIGKANNQQGLKKQDVSSSINNQNKTTRNVRNNVIEIKDTVYNQNMGDFIELGRVTNGQTNNDGYTVKGNIIDTRSIEKGFFSNDAQGNNSINDNISSINGLSSKNSMANAVINNVNKELNNVNKELNNEINEEFIINNGRSDLKLLNYKTDKYVNNGQRYKFDSLILEMDTFDISHIHDFQFIIFICSTHGDGDHPFNMRSFWKFLMLRDNKEDLLVNINYAVYGLGDSSYEKYNYCSKKLFNRLKKLGGKAIVKRGDGDSQDVGGYIETFKPWVAELYANIITLKEEENKQCKKNTNKSIDNEESNAANSLRNNLYGDNECDYGDSKHKDITNNSNDKKQHTYLKGTNTNKIYLKREGNPITSNILIEENIDTLNLNVQSNSNDVYKLNRILLTASILGTQMLTPDLYEYPMLRVTFDIPDYTSYYPGDVISIKPENYNHNEFIQYNKLPLKYKDSIQKIFDINHVPSQFIFRDLHDFIQNKHELPNHKMVLNKLNELFVDYNAYYDYIVMPKRTFFEVLKDFYILINYSFIEKYVPEIMYRHFTLIKKENTYSIIITLVSYQTSIKEKRVGLCSEFLKNIQSCNLNVFINKSVLFFGENNNQKKILFICTGSGIGLPYTAINYFKNTDCVLYYGFRFKDKDRLFSDELVCDEETLEGFYKIWRDSFFGLDDKNYALMHDNISEEDVRKSKNYFMINKTSAINNKNYEHNSIKEQTLGSTNKNMDGNNSFKISEHGGIINDCCIKKRELLILEAISRENNKEYVQDVLRRVHPIDINDYYVIVSGNSRLNKQIRKVLRDLFKDGVDFQSETW